MSNSAYSTSTWLPGTNIPSIDIGNLTMYGEKKLPNKKLSINVHEAHGGYIIEIVTSSMPGDLYIIGDDKNMGEEIGKIITHAVLNKNHE